MRHASDDEPEKDLDPDDFDEPCDVVRDETLDEEEKREILEEWESEERALEVADDEGMKGGNPPRLDEVKRAENALDD